jgi:hypothetical protein
MQYDAEAKRLGMAWIAQHPAGFVKLMPFKLMRLWAPDGEAQWHFERGWAPWERYATLGHAIRLANQGFMCCCCWAWWPSRWWNCAAGCVQNSD